jgi:hypothetical protein
MPELNLNPSGVRMHYTQEPALILDSPLPSLLCYIVSGQWVGAGYGKVLIPNTNYKGKGRTELASSNLTPRVQRCRPPPRICYPHGTMEFIDDGMKEEKEELSNKLVASLKQKIITLEEQIAELHQVVYDQLDDFGVLRKGTTGKLKHFAMVLGDPSLYDAPPP